MNKKITVRKLEFGDIFTLSKIYEKLDLQLNFDPEINTEAMKTLIFDELFKKLYKAEKEVISLVGSLTGLTSKDVKSMGIAFTIDVITQLISDDDFNVFLQQAKK